MPWLDKRVHPGMHKHSVHVCTRSPPGLHEAEALGTLHVTGCVCPDYQQLGTLELCSLV